MGCPVSSSNEVRAEAPGTGDLERLTGLQSRYSGVDIIFFSDIFEGVRATEDPQANFCGVRTAGSHRIGAYAVLCRLSIPSLL